MTDDPLPRVDAPIRFRRRPNSVTADFRPSWKLSVLLLLLYLSSRGGKSSLTRLHVLNWAVRNTKHQEEFKRTINSDMPLFEFKVRFEPAFSRAIDLAAAARLVNWVGGNRIELTEQGKSIAKALVQQQDAFQPEIQFLNGLGKNLTEDKALSLAKGADIA